MLSADGKVRYAVVAGGWISQGAFMPGVEQTGNSVMTALVTADPAKADKLAERYQLKSYHYNHFSELLGSGEIDAVYVATPNHLHRQFVVPALEAGIHVLLEKPMATSEEDCQAIRAAAERSGARLMIAYRLHCEPGTLEMIERARSGEFGDLRLFTSIFTQMIKPENHRMQHGYWAGPVPDMGTYPINAVRNLFGLEPIEVYAVGSHTPGRNIATPDVVTVVLRFPDERHAQFTLSYSAAATDRFQLVGTKGEIEASPCYGFGEGTAINYRATLEGEVKEHTHPIVDQFSSETAYFSDCILNDRAPEPDGEEGWLDVRILAAVERALETGQPQSLEPMTRSKRATRDQVRQFPLAEVPEFINTTDPAT
ncbi:Gfo/Idh/MocA family protein [Azomonas macrocytogenes]|uniref:Putative dehydrogenase n=1 Tax=Azomonas macrocytogenes TaxID=69962 RepID=A0A839T2Z2_AZOMA|nr:Gfo/Idh/MocA family oxidoreductase [Azomonas macrocytogenes]MBB3103369.1 putative dehydrogenase [Azomonas macrocytogenes]